MTSVGDLMLSRTHPWNHGAADNRDLKTKQVSWTTSSERMEQGRGIWLRSLIIYVNRAEIKKKSLFWKPVYQGRVISFVIPAHIVCAHAHWALRYADFLRDRPAQTLEVRAPCDLAPADARTERVAQIAASTGGERFLWCSQLIWADVTLLLLIDCQYGLGVKDWEWRTGSEEAAG